MQSAEDISPVQPGDVVGRYRIAERIGAGGMAEVFRATMEGEWGYRKQVVLKLVLPELASNEEYVELFLDEARLTAALAHPNLPQTYELGVHQGRHFLTMEYVHGLSLWKVVQRTRERRVLLPLDVSLKVVGQLLECLSYVHHATDETGAALNIVHRDVSPGNLIVTDEGAVKLLDFGIARARISEHRTAAGQVRGKMGYMSPEQCRGLAVDHRTDLYATGTLLYLLTVGLGPFEQRGDFFAMVQACAAGDFPRPRDIQPSLDPELEAIILTALALRPEDRYESAGAMIDALDALALKLRIMPRTRGVAATLRDLFPERPPPPPLRRRTSSRLMRSVTAPRPGSEMATEPQNAAVPRASAPLPPPVPSLAEEDDESSAMTTVDGFTPVSTPRVFPTRKVAVITAVVVAVVLSFVAAIVAVTRPEPDNVPPPVPLKQFPEKKN